MLVIKGKCFKLIMHLLVMEANPEHIMKTATSVAISPSFLYTIVLCGTLLLGGVFGASIWVV